MALSSGADHWKVDFEAGKMAARICKNEERKERIAGGILWFGVVMVSVGIPWGLLYLAGKVSFWLRFALETFWCYQLLAGKCLKDESRKFMYSS